MLIPAVRLQVAVLLYAVSASGLAEAERPYSPPVAEPFARQLLWGDTHVHTNFSLDALLYNNYRVGPDEAYRFARGEAVDSSSGQRVQLAQPLDFLVVADHAEFMATSWRLLHPDAAVSSRPELAPLIDGASGGFPAQGAGTSHSQHFFELSQRLDENLGMDRRRVADTWRELLASAERYNDPGQFTALLGFEWSSNPGGNNLHRVVVLRDDAQVVAGVLPFSSTTSEDPAALWQWLADYERDTGGRALAIPHNGNVSNGLMFAPTDFSGKPLDADYARMRERWEPLYEVTQMKGDAETHPMLSPRDEFANFERWDDSNIFFSAPKTPDMLQYEYARSSLLNGLALEAKLGVNPFRFGLIGSTDTHTGLSTAAENNFWNKVSFDEPVKGRASHLMSEKGRYGAVVSRRTATISGSGYAAVWSTENSRGAIFDALQRREAYGTTGSRIALRLFAGWSFEVGDEQRSDRDSLGYRKGVPMGADLPPRPGRDRAPSLLVYAQKDPAGANLERLQIIKGWLDNDGSVHEKIYTIAQGEHATNPGEHGTVDIEQASYRNNIGSPILETVWSDPDFDPATPAFYYVRVLEIPTPRWTTIDAAFYGTPLPDEVPAVIRERAYSSPVWYRPQTTSE